MFCKIELFGRFNLQQRLSKCGFCDIASARTCAVCWHFRKNVVEGDDKQDCCEQVPIYGNFHATFATTDAMLSCRTGSHPEY